MSVGRVRVDLAGVSRAVGADIDAATRRAAERARDRVRGNITKAGRSNSGTMARTIYVQQMSHAPLSPSYEVGSDLHYALYQEEGVPGPITPKRAKVLRFKPRGSSVYVFARETKGFAGIHMFRRALDAVKVADFLP